MLSNHLICTTEYFYVSSSTQQLATTTTGCDLSVVGSSIGLMFGVFIALIVFGYIINYLRFKI